MVLSNHLVSFWKDSNTHFSLLFSWEWYQEDFLKRNVLLESFRYKSSSILIAHCFDSFFRPNNSIHAEEKKITWALQAYKIDIMPPILSGLRFYAQTMWNLTSDDDYSRSRRKSRDHRMTKFIKNWKFHIGHSIPSRSQTSTARETAKKNSIWRSFVSDIHLHMEKKIINRPTS